jgi:hypothetical protein
MVGIGSVIAWSEKANGRESKSCLRSVFNFKFGSFSAVKEDHSANA